MNFDTFLASLQKILSKAPKVTASDAQLLMVQHYHEEFGIANYNEDTMRMHPLNHVAMHPAEDPITGSFLVETLKRFAFLKIGDIFNISLDNFLGQPQYLCELMFEIAEPMQKDLADRENKVMNEIEKASGLVDANGRPIKSS